MADELGRYLSIVTLLAGGLLGIWTAVACRRALSRGLPGADAIVWASIGVTFIFFGYLKFARGVGFSFGLGSWLRTLAREQGLYADRRTVQIIATAAVALVVIGLLIYGLIWMWHHFKRYRLAIGFASICVGYSLIRFISLHEVDAWHAAIPGAHTIADIIAAVGASAVALARLRQLARIGITPIDRRPTMH